MGDLSNLPKDLIRLIVARLQFLSDIQRFAFVCHSWCSVAMETCHLFHPLLILSYEVDAETCNFYSPVDKKVFRLHLPELHGKWCCGTSKGWLITADDDLVVHLLHPFSRAQVSLPPFSPLSPRSAVFRENVFESYQETGEWKSFFVQKLILSSSPLDPDCVFMIIGGIDERISICRATDETWTTVYPFCHLFSDAIFHEGRIFGARPSNLYSVINASSYEIEDDPYMPPSRKIPECDKAMYFVESSGDLLCVIKYLKYIKISSESNAQGCIISHETFDFEVFKLIDEEEEEPWERVTCLGDRALFVGRNHSFSLSITRYPAYKANHIFFTDDFVSTCQHHEMGEFNLEDGSITFYDLEAHTRYWQPVWFKQHQY